jgi:SAM-dependent methyltransferase
MLPRFLRSRRTPGDGSGSGRTGDRQTPPTRYCVQCESAVDAFVPYRDGSVDLVSAVLKVIGSDVRNFACPLCWGFDRERHLIMYFDALDLWADLNGARVLHIAPEPDFGRRVRDLAQHYVAGDLEPTQREVERIDLTTTPFASESFNVIIANHVLEHIPRDDLALAEIARLLSPGGVAILQTPFSPRLTASLENATIVEPDIRAVLFGQEDHVRVFGLDLFDRIAACGLVVTITSHGEALQHIDPDRYGVNPDEPLIRAMKASTVEA